jgi:tetratricopeptide (TPR) repeat protein
MGRIDDARLHAEYAVMLDPQSALAQASLGVVLTIRGKFDEALSHLRTAVALEPSLYPANSSLGIAFLQQRQFDSAYYYLNRAFTINGGKVQDYDLLIQAALGAGRFDEAARLVSRFERLAPGAPNLEAYKKVIAERRRP